MRYEAKAKSALIAEGLGINSAGKPTVLELDAPNLTADDIRASLSDADVVYVEGGNTFYLQFCMLRTGFWSVADPLLQTRELTYVGASAGAIVAGASIETAFWKGWDVPIAPSMGMDGWEWSPATLQGSGYVKCSLFMHFDEQYAALVREKKRPDAPVICIRDSAAVLVPSLPGSEPVELRGDGTLCPISFFT